MIRLIASADIHLGRSSTQLPREAGHFPTSMVWECLVDKAIEKKADAVLLSGDVIDRENRYFEAVGRLQHGFEQLKNAGIHVFMVSGNHDFDVLPGAVNEHLSSHIHLLGEGGNWQLMDFQVNDLTIRFAGWSFPDRYFRDDPLRDFPGETVNSNSPVIGLLHGDLAMPDSPYAPLNLASLQSKGVNLWALGHIHKPGKWTVPGCEVRYPGSPQALSPKEEGAHGALWIEIGPDHQIKTSELILSPVRYETLRLDVTGCEEDVSLRKVVTSALDELAKNVEQESGATVQCVVDLVVTGTLENTGLIKEVLSDQVDSFYRRYATTALSVRKLVNQVLPAVSNFEELALQSSPAGLVAQTIRALEKGESTALLEKMEAQWNKNFSSLKHSNTFRPLLRRGRDQLFTDEQENRRSEYLLMACKQLLAELLAQKNNIGQ